MKVVWNRQASRSSTMNAWLLQDSIVDPTLFLIFIYELSNVISSQVGIYAYETTIESCLNNKPGSAVKVNLAESLEKRSSISG